MDKENILLKFVETGVIESPHFETHKRGQNWAALLIGKNSLNFNREYLKRSYKNIEVSHVKVGDAIEIAGDYISSSGNRTTNRGYYFVKEISENGLICEEYPTIAKILKEKNKG